MNPAPPVFSGWSRPREVTISTSVPFVPVSRQYYTAVFPSLRSSPYPVVHTKYNQPTIQARRNWRCCLSMLTRKGKQCTCTAV